jgi:sortase A
MQARQALKALSAKQLLVTGSLLLLFCTGCLCLAAGGFIYLKAQLAGVLLRSAWEKTMQARQPVKPWPWADTFPIARLTAPAWGIDEIVLAGAQGPVLAFGPGHISHTGEPCGPDNCVLVGHRDTSFRFLKELVPGSEIFLENRLGVRRTYRVSGSRVISAHDTWVLDPAKAHSLTLITCYPFDELLPGPGRYVVWAKEFQQVD